MNSEHNVMHIKEIVFFLPSSFSDWDFLLFSILFYFLPHIVYINSNRIPSSYKWKN
jgi:hypothetical protein